LADDRLQTPAPREQLPSGRSRHGLSPDEVAATQRARLLDGLIGAVAEKGYAALTVADVSAAARVSRRTFYEHFSDKEDCFMAAIGAGTTEVLAAMAAAGAQGRDLHAAVRASIDAYLRGFVERPAFARAFNVEILASGARGLEFRAEVHQRFAEMYQVLAEQLRERGAAIPDIPPIAFRLATGAFDEILLEWVRQDRIAELEQLAPLASFIAEVMVRGADSGTKHLDAVTSTLAANTLPA
jgi:AcrR family transcriptional regulator